MKCNKFTDRWQTGSVCEPLTPHTCAVRKEWSIIHGGSPVLKKSNNVKILTVIDRFYNI